MKTLTVSKCVECKTKEGDGFYRNGLCRSCYAFHNERNCEIVRMYYPDNQGNTKRPRRLGYGLMTEAECQAHCKDPKTRKEGVYFDGYQNA